MAKKKPRKDDDALTACQPSVAVLVKLGSIVVHCDELFSKDGHHFDKMALDQLVHDPEVRKWLDAMNKMALIPLKRN